MAQTGYTPIQLYYSTTASNTPSVANLSLGELGINLADQKAYMLNAAGTAVVTLVGTLGNQNANSVSITGGSINGTTIGATTASTGAFTTISATGVITSTVATGTAPFTIASTTQVANLNAATAGTATNATNTAITDNTSSSATWYPTIVSATTGNLPQTTSSTKLSFVPSTGTLTATSHAGAWAGSTIGTTYGGTGQTSYAVGDLLYADTTTSLAKLSDVATGNALISGGVSTAPSWGKIGLTTHVSGVLPVANGGTNASSASITSFNNITGYSAAGATGTTSTNLVFSTSPTLVTPTLGAALATSIKFGSGTVLNDYEEGTWTPIVGGSATYNTQTGSYTKVGRLVYVRFNINILAIGSGSTTLVSGLPFTPSATRMAGSMAYWAGLATNVLYLGTFVDNTGFNFISQILPGANVTDGTAILGSGTVIHAAAVYFV